MSVTSNCGAAENQVPINSQRLRVIQELGWSDNDFYTSIVVNSSVIIDDSIDLDTELLVKYIFEVAKLQNSVTILTATIWLL